MTDAELLEEERKKKEAAAMGEVQPQAPVMDMSQENPDFGAMLRSSGIPDSNVVSQVPGIENVQNPGVFDPEKIEPVEPVGTPTTVGESIRQTYNESVLADLINKGFGQEAFQSKSLDGTPTYSIYNKRFGTLGSQVPYSEASPEAKAQAMKFMLSTGGQERPLPATPTSPVLNAEQVQGVLNEQRAATEASASDATPSVTPTIESPSGGAQGQAGATAPSGGLTTVGGAPLSEFLGGQAMPERGFTQPERPMAGRGVTLTPGQMDELSAAREARLEARRPGDQAVSDRDRRAARGEGISMADRTAMAKANASGASPSEIARGNKIADELGVDLETGQPLQPAGGLTFEQQLALRKEQRAEREEVRSVAEQEREWEQTQGEARQKRVDEMNTEIGALTSIIGQAENISGVATEASRKVGAGTTGFFSPIKWIGGTTAADLAGNLETIKSDAFVANITEMRQNSPTGGAVGNVSDKDLEMLQSLQTSFRQNLKPTTLKKNLKKYKDIRDKVARDAKAGFIRKYGAENFNTYFGNQQQGGTQVSSIPNDRDSNTQVDPELQQYFN
jgi:hypothetical protein